MKQKTLFRHMFAKVVIISDSTSKKKRIYFYNFLKQGILT